MRPSLHDVYDVAFDVHDVAFNVHDAVYDVHDVAFDVHDADDANDVTHYVTFDVNNRPGLKCRLLPVELTCISMM